MAVPRETTAAERYDPTEETEEQEVLEEFELSAEESRRLFDETARHFLGMSGEEFLRRWFGGDYEGVYLDTPELMPVISALPLVIYRGSPEAERYRAWLQRHATAES